MDTAEVGDLKAMDEAGFLDGVTTNPSLIAKSGRDFKEVVAEICELTKTPVSAEVAALETAGMIAEGERLASIADNVVVKLPLTIDGLIACQYFKRIGVKTNVTLCFTPSQALLAAKAGATYISPFIGRLDDIGLDGCQLVRDIRAIYDTYHFDTEIIAASVRTVNHVTEAAIAGSDIATMPPSLFEKLIDHPLTKVGVEKFVDDWKSTGQSIL